MNSSLPLKSKTWSESSPMPSTPQKGVKQANQGNHAASYSQWEAGGGPHATRRQHGCKPVHTIASLLAHVFMPQRQGVPVEDSPWWSILWWVTPRSRISHIRFKPRRLLMTSEVMYWDQSTKWFLPIIFATCWFLSVTVFSAPSFQHQRISFCFQPFKVLF